ncbi:MAG: DUF4314 domain-containing protein [Firmicutes bacterium]|nr:DUF4314 domain-containing protein [Bacillota bacterium]
MSEIISKAALEARRARYTPGTRVELVRFSDEYSSLKPGDRGTVELVDDAGGCHIAFDNGSHLAALWQVDEIRVVASIPPEAVASVKEIAQSGETNMLDAKAVFQIAVRDGHDALADFVFSHTPQYSAFILSGIPDLE